MDPEVSYPDEAAGGFLLKSRCTCRSALSSTFRCAAALHIQVSAPYLPGQKEQQSFVLVQEVLHSTQGRDS